MCQPNSLPLLWQRRARQSPPALATAPPRTRSSRRGRPDDRYAREALVPGEREVVRAWTENSPGIARGRGVNYQLLGDGHGHAIQPYMISFAPGAGYARDRIGHPGEEFAYVLLGSIEVVLADEVHALSQGDAIRFDTTTPHAFRNASRNGVAVVVGAATPPW
jgi:quercetin dioxygenase-like cupin family protein